MLSESRRFMEFMIRREDLRIKKESGQPWPWSDDQILSTYKFTNVKRENDRTTRWMREFWTGPNELRPGGEIVFNCALFRYFGTSEFAAAAGWQRYWDPNALVALAKQRQKEKKRVFTGAYIIPTLGYRGSKAEAVAHLILTPLWDRRDVISRIAEESGRWEITATYMRKLPGFGGTGFMTKEVLQDLMHTPVLGHAKDRDTWCPAGPGARRGLNRIWGRPIALNRSESACIDEMVELLDLSRVYLPNHMPNLELHDIQFQLCEFDKYERVRLGQGRPRSLYKLDGTAIN